VSYFRVSVQGFTPTRTELIVLITPHVIRSSDDARAITEELQRKVPMTIPVLKLGNGR
jgi:type II secretory pathway component GspD/PulD (secretin)